jgi:hypothetical protein
VRKSTAGRSGPKKVPVDSRKVAKQAKKADKKAAKAMKKGEHGRITPSNAKKVIGVIKVVGPALAPVAIWTASAVRERYDRIRARRLGVPVDELGTFTGRGAALHARIASDTNALRELRAQSAGGDEAKVAAQRFAERTAARLEQLTSAVRAAERMPTQRRKSAHRAVNTELGQIEDELLTRLGVPAKKAR